jgi:integrase
MKPNATASSARNNQTKQSQSHASKFTKVKDGRKQPVRGLWVRNGRYYARLNVENPVTGAKRTKWVPLVDKDQNPVQTVSQAIAELHRLQTRRADDNLPKVGRTPKFADYVKDYLRDIAAGQGAKAPATVGKETSILGRWVEHLGHLRINQIKRVNVDAFIKARRKEVDDGGNPKVSNRTINLDVIGLRCVLKDALNAGLIQRLPMEGMKPLDEVEIKRPLFTSAMLDKLCEAGGATKNDKDGKEIPLTKNAREFVDYLQLMAYSGARRNEALGLQWDDVDFDNAQLHLRRQVTDRVDPEKNPCGIEPLKNGEERTVDFNANLRSHLEDMATRKAPDSKWLFPSPQRGEKDIPAKSFRESLDMVRGKAGMPNFGFHDLRHHFISMCVMSGIDFMTIAAWVGHKDGGVLIGKVYGHLANEHRKAMAERVNFGPSVVPLPQAARTA